MPASSQARSALSSALIAAAFAVAGCATLAGLDDFEDEAQNQDGGAGTGGGTSGAGGGTAATGGGGTSGGGGSGGASGAGGVSGASGASAGGSSGAGGSTCDPQTCVSNPPCVDRACSEGKCVETLHDGVECGLNPCRYPGSCSGGSCQLGGNLPDNTTVGGDFCCGGTLIGPNNPVYCGGCNTTCVTPNPCCCDKTCCPTNPGVC